MNYVRLATTINISLSGTQSVDGSSTTTGDRVLVKDQTTNSENGVYVAQNSGNWTRATDFDSTDEGQGQIVHVLAGSENAGTNWQCVQYPTHFRQLPNNGDWLQLLQLEQNSLQVGVALADSTETISLSGGHRRLIGVLTNNRTKTLSTTGAQLGDLWTFERTDLSRHRLTILDESLAVVGHLDRPGRLTARFNGAAWMAESEPAPGRTFTPQQFGFKFCAFDDAAQIEDNTDAIIAMFETLDGAAGNDPNFNARVFFPGGDYWVDDEIRIENTGSAGAITIEGEYGGVPGLVGTRILASENFPASGSKAVVKTVGVSGLTVRNIEVRAQGLAKYAWWAAIETGKESCSSHFYERVTFAEARNTAEGAQFAAGPEGALDPSAATQSDNMRFVACSFTGDTSTSYAAQGFRTCVGGNTKNFSFFGCVWAWNEYHIDWQHASGPLSVFWGSFESSFSADIRCGDSQLTVQGAISERSSMAIESSAATASADVSGWTWNGTTLDDSWEALRFRGALNLRGSVFWNFRAWRQVLSVDTTANTLDVSANPDGLESSLMEDQRVRFMASSGATLPAPFKEGVDYYVIRVDDDTIQLEASLGGGAIDITSAGSGTINLVSESRISGPDDLSAGSLISEGNLFIGTSQKPGRAPLANGGIGNDPLGQTYSLTVSPTRISSVGDRAGIPGRYFMLRDVRGIPQDVAGFMPYTSHVSLSVPFLTVIYEGRPSGDGYVACYEMTTDNLKAFGATTSGQAYIQLAAKTQVRRVIVDVLQPVAASGLTDAKIQIQDAAGSSGDVIASNDADAVATYGLVAGDLGAKLAAGNLVQGGFVPSGGWAGFTNLLAVVTTTGANLSTLTAGRIRIYVTVARTL